jgi:hypothetical protein
METFQGFPCILPITMLFVVGRLHGGGGARAAATGRSPGNPRRRSRGIRIWAKAQIRLAETIAEDDGAITALRDSHRRATTARWPAVDSPLNGPFGDSLVVRGVDTRFTLTGQGRVIVARGHVRGVGGWSLLMGSERGSRLPTRLRISNRRAGSVPPREGRKRRSRRDSPALIKPNVHGYRRSDRPGESGETHSSIDTDNCCG